MNEPGSYTALLWVVVLALSGAFGAVVTFLKVKMDINEKRCAEDRARADEKQNQYHQARE